MGSGTDPGIVSSTTWTTSGFPALLPRRPLLEVGTLNELRTWSRRRSSAEISPTPGREACVSLIFFAGGGSIIAGGALVDRVGSSTLTRTSPVCRWGVNQDGWSIKCGALMVPVIKYKKTEQGPRPGGLQDANLYTRYLTDLKLTA